VQLDVLLDRRGRRIYVRLVGCRRLDDVFGDEVSLFGIDLVLVDVFEFRPAAALQDLRVSDEPSWG